MRTEERDVNTNSFHKLLMVGDSTATRRDGACTAFHIYIYILV